MIKRLLACALLCLPLSAGEQDNSKIQGTTKDIRWGQHWAGPNLKNENQLKGKVTLLVIWGG